MVTEIMTASCGFVGLSLPGAFSHVPDAGVVGARALSAVRPKGAVGPVGTGPVGTGPVGTGSVSTGAVQNPVVTALGQPTSVDTTVRKQHNNTYMTRFTAHGGDAPGPHRWRVPV